LKQLVGRKAGGLRFSVPRRTRFSADLAEKKRWDLPPSGKGSHQHMN